MNTHQACDGPRILMLNCRHIYDKSSASLNSVSVNGSYVSAKCNRFSVMSVIDPLRHKGSGLLSNFRLPRDMTDLSQSEADSEVEFWFELPANADRALARKRRLHQGPPTRPASPPSRRLPMPPSRPASPLGLEAVPWLGLAEFPIMI